MTEPYAEAGKRVEEVASPDMDRATLTRPGRVS
jgi:hypothetical protein